MKMEGEDDHPVVYVHDLDPHTRAYVCQGIHHRELKVSHPYDIAVDLTEIDEL